MFTCLWIPESFCQPKVDNIHEVLLFTDTNQKVVWLYVSMQEVTGVYELQPLEHLISKHKHCLQ